MNIIEKGPIASAKNRISSDEMGFFQQNTTDFINQ